MKQVVTAAESYVRQHWLVGTFQRRLVCRVTNQAASVVLAALGRCKFVCPLCDYCGPFFAYMTADSRRENAMCPGCGSLERHRLQRLVLDAIPERSRFGTFRLLHFAPEPFFTRFFRQIVREYTSADLSGHQADYAADITRLPFQNESFDLVYASHVLEHVQEDRQALAEIRRVLRPSGIAILPVPVFRGINTVEYPEPNPHEVYHVRQPGDDYYDRYDEFFARVVKYSSRDFRPECQLYIHEDRTKWPTPAIPHRRPTPGYRHEDVVPVCYK